MKIILALSLNKTRSNILRPLIDYITGTITDTFKNTLLALLIKKKIARQERVS